MSELYVIPSTQETTFKKLRVAAYVRVSTDDYDQENSFLNQYDYYSRYIGQAWCCDNCANTTYCDYLY